MPQLNMRPFQHPYYLWASGLLFLLVTILTSWPLQAQPEENLVSKSLRACLSSIDNLSRLQCYDDLITNLDASLENNAMANDDRLVTNAIYNCRLLEQYTQRLECFDTASTKISSSNDIVEKPREEVELKPPPSFLVQSWQISSQADRGPFVITPYKPTYVMPISYSKEQNQNVFGLISSGEQVQHFELKFQISFKTKIWPDVLGTQADIWFAYTQVSYWQAYNEKASSPFRESNYEPEFLFSWPISVSFFGLTSRMLAVSLNHQSNGRSDPLSRSWNRIILSGYFDIDQNVALVPRVWHRFKESTNDDNPNIKEYAGRGEVNLYWKNNLNTYTVSIHNSMKDSFRGGIQINWSHTVNFLPIKPYIQYFYGYGESLIDYDMRQSRLSIGLLLTDWF